MTGWNKITLFKFQQIDAIITNKEMPDIDKVLFSTCVVFDKTEYELDNLPMRKVGRLVDQVTKIFDQIVQGQFDFKPTYRIGVYFLNYDPASMTFGQYVELSFFLQNHFTNAHYVMASISSILWMKNNSSQHRKKSEYFLNQPTSKIIGSLKLFIERFKAFNDEYKSLFGLDPEVSGDTAQVNIFNKRFGWIYSATQVAEHERITLDETFDLPVRQALNDLVFIKARAKYEAELLKQKPHA